MQFVQAQSLTIHPWSLALLAAGLIAALFIEQRTQRIPNYLTVTMAAAGIALAIVDGAWGLHLLGFLAGLVVGVALWIPAIMQAGVVKLLAAVGAVTNPLFLALFVILSAPLIIGCVWLKREKAADDKQAGETRREYVRGSWLIAGSCVLAAGFLGILRHYG